MSVAVLREMAVFYGAYHEDDCPCDDTCDCRHKAFNDRVNAACDDTSERIEKLEKHLAYLFAASDLESNFLLRREGNKFWIDLQGDYKTDSLEYLKLRGLIEQHPTEAWIDVMDEPE